MNIIIQFVSPVSEGRFLANLRNVKKNCSMLRHYVAEVVEDKNKFYLSDQNGNAVSEFDYYFLEEKQAIRFENFRGKYKEEIEKMLSFRLVEEIGEKAFVCDKEKKMKLFFDLDEFFLIEKKGVYKIGTDYERIIKIESYRVPREVKMSQN